MVVCGLEVKCGRVRKDEVGFLEGWRRVVGGGNEGAESVGLLVALKAQAPRLGWSLEKERTLKAGHH